MELRKCIEIQERICNQALGICSKCALQIGGNKLCMELLQDITKYEEVLKKWVKENPIKKNWVVFKERNPDVKQFYKYYSCPNDALKIKDCDCITDILPDANSLCRNKYNTEKECCPVWDEEYKEQT